MSLSSAGSAVRCPLPAVGSLSPRLFALVSVEELFERRYRIEHLANSPPGTIEQYRTQLAHLDRWRKATAENGEASGPLTVRHLTRDAILACRAWLLQTPDPKTEKPRTVATANKFCRHVAAIWRFAIEEGLVQEEARPIKRLKEPKRKPRAWRVSDLGAMLSVAARRAGLICGLRASSWWRAFYLVMYDTGLRVSTQMDLRWDHFNPRDGVLRIPAELVKDDEELVHELSPQTLSALLALRGSGAAEIFPWASDRDRKWRTLRKRHRANLREASLPWQGRRDGGFHKIRSTTASYLKRSGGNPTEHLGHSTEQVTRVYLDKRICRPRRQVDLLPRPQLAEPDPQMRLF